MIKFGIYFSRICYTALFDRKLFLKVLFIEIQSLLILYGSVFTLLMNIFNISKENLTVTICVAFDTIQQNYTRIIALA